MKSRSAANVFEENNTNQVGKAKGPIKTGTDRRPINIDSINMVLDSAMGLSVS